MSSCVRVSWLTGGIIALCCVAGEAAQIPFGTANVLSGSFDGASSVAVADVDLDGDLDVVAAAAFAPEVAWWENPTTGGGGWVEHAIGADPDQPWFVAAGDLDRDGDVDVVVGSRDSYDIVDLLWYANPEVDGGASWTAHTIVGLVTEGMRSVSLADFDRDGDLDVVVTRDTNGSASSIMVYVNDGGMPPADGWDSHMVAATDGLGAYGLATADIDGDGDLDVVASLYYADDVRWYRNDGSELWVGHDVDTSLDGAIGVAVADVNRDGKPDVLASGYLADEVAWYEQTGASWTKHTVATGLDGAWALRGVDLDADGDVDVVATARFGDDLVWLENLDGVGGAWAAHVVDGGFDGARSVAAADLDNDGDLDLVGAAEDGDDLAWWENETIHRRFLLGDQRTIRDDMSDGAATVVADLSRDGKNDVAATMFNDGDVRAWMRFDQAGSLWWETSVDTSCPGAADLAVGDVDGDGDLDLAGVGRTGNSVTWWESSGTALPTWTPHQLTSSFTGASAVALADLDRDGDLDLLAGTSSSKVLAWWENDTGTGSAWTSHVIDTGVGVRDLAVGYVNHDGLLDIVAVAYGDIDQLGIVVVYLGFNPDTNAWWEDEVASGLDDTMGVTIADVDRDGHNDIVATYSYWGEDEVGWFAGDGSGVTWAWQNLQATGLLDPRSPHVADLDADGDLDVAVVERNGNRLTWWEHTGSDWVSHLSDGVDAPHGLALGDLTGDGRTDVAVAAAGSSHGVFWRPDLGGQYGLEASDLAPHRMGDSESAAVLALHAVHYGRSGDAEVELARVELTFTDLYGQPLSSAAANALVDELRLYLDDGDLAWDDGDTLVAIGSTLPLDPDGSLSLSPPDGLSDFAVAPGAAKVYFVVLTTTATASSQEVEAFRVTHRASGAIAEDRDHDLVLALDGASTDCAAGLVYTGGSYLFADGFDSGGAAAWSATAP